MDMISAGIIALMFILLIVFTVMSAKTWHWVNIVFVNLTFLAGVGAAIGLSQALHLRHTAMMDLKQSRESSEKNQAAADLAVFGNPESATYDRDSLRGVTHEMSLVFTGRGRVWSGGQISAAGDMRDFKFATARPADTNNDLKLKDSLMYVFADGAIGNQPFPQSYIGSVMVAEETLEKVTLRPVFIADQKEWLAPTTSWSLFEKMPLDRHDTFRMAIVAAADAQEDAPEQLKTFAQSILKDEMEIGPFRQILQARYLRPELFNLDPASLEYEKLVDQYAFDGMSLGKIRNWIEANAANRVSQRFEPAPEEIFIRYKFKKKSNKAYKVNADGSLDTDGPFTQLGQAIDVALHADKDVEFAVDDTVLVDSLTAKGQRGNELGTPFDQTEDVDEVDQIYVRPLRDFPYLFSDLSLQTVNLVEEAAAVEENIAVQLKSLTDAEAQLEDRMKTTAGLEEDSSNMKTDLDVINELQARRDEEVRNLKSQIASLKTQIQKSYDRIEELTRAVEQQVYAGG